MNELEATPNRIERITLRQNNVVNYNLRHEGICLAREERNSCYLSSNIGGKNMDEARQIAMEEWVINFLDNRRKEKNMTVEDWARLVFPDTPASAARMRLQGLRKPQGSTGKRKRLIFSEFTRMARAPDIAPSEVCTLAENELGALSENIQT